MKNKVSPIVKPVEHPCLKISKSFLDDCTIIGFFTSDIDGLILHVEGEDPTYKVGTHLELTVAESLEFEPFGGILSLSNW